eukprot:TRINITY_DN8858_c1_g1_i1.p1 TRINITY_DN8858_c1_g1~~TRINITY_DN8858_c1_g1_i1.p1  ORF type:complete len:221 (-),score=69.99 TRINITY_DN8858_c1_g1_i1:69-731(-)
MVKHNNVLTNNHFRKQWDRKTVRSKVITYFEQPMRKVRRRQVRAAKAAAIYPKPVTGALRPLVHGQSQRYNTRVRFGRGFTLGELKGAGLTPAYAQSVGIAVDYRRSNKSAETLQANVQRLKLYKSKLVVFPLKSGQPKNGDSKPEEIAAAVQQTAVLPYKVNVTNEKARAVTSEEAGASAYLTIRAARGKQRKIGDAIRAARIEAAGAGAKGGKKKGKK